MHGIVIVKFKQLSLSHFTIYCKIGFIICLLIKIHLNVFQYQLKNVQMDFDKGKFVIGFK